MPITDWAVSKKMIQVNLPSKLVNYDELTIHWSMK